MPSVIRVLLHDTDIPAPLRADLRAYESGASASVRQAAGRRAARALQESFDLSELEIEALFAPAWDEVAPSRAA